MDDASNIVLAVLDMGSVDQEAADGFAHVATW
jgi:hypothetical protein